MGAILSRPHCVKALWHFRSLDRWFHLVSTSLPTIVCLFLFSTDASHKTHNASGKYPTMCHFVTEMCTCVHFSVTKWCIVWYETGALWDLCNRSRVCRPGAIVGATIRVPCHTVKSQQLIWSDISDAYIFNSLNPPCKERTRVHESTSIKPSDELWWLNRKIG